jgi:hypothetical protein
MKKNHNLKYSEISTFEDLHAEKERLIFRSKISAAKFNLTYLRVRDALSLSNQLFTFAKSALLPRISDFMSDLLKKGDKTADS